MPIRTKEVSAGESLRNRVMSPIESTPTVGQKVSSKTKKMLRDAMSRLRSANAQIRISSCRIISRVR